MNDKANEERCTHRVQRFLLSAANNEVALAFVSEIDIGCKDGI